MDKKEQILHSHIDKESMDYMSVNIWPDMLEAMDEYAQTITSLPSDKQIEKKFPHRPMSPAYNREQDLKLDVYKQGLRDQYKPQENNFESDPSRLKLAPGATLNCPNCGSPDHISCVKLPQNRR